MNKNSTHKRTGKNEPLIQGLFYKLSVTAIQPALHAGIFLLLHFLYATRNFLSSKKILFFLGFADSFSKTDVKPVLLPIRTNHAAGMKSVYSNFSK